jgi:hypothetical protein
MARSHPLHTRDSSRTAPETGPAQKETHHAGCANATLSQNQHRTTTHCGHALVLVLIVAILPDPDPTTRASTGCRGRVPRRFAPTMAAPGPSWAQLTFASVHAPLLVQYRRNPTDSLSKSEQGLIMVVMMP